MLALALILEAYTGVSDDEVIEAAVMEGRELAEVAQEAGAEVVCGTSLKAMLDQDWDQLRQREEALNQVLNVLRVVEQWVHTLQQDEMKLVEPSLHRPPGESARCADR